MTSKNRVWEMDYEVREGDGLFLCIKNIEVAAPDRDSALEEGRRLAHAKVFKKLYEPNPAAISMLLRRLDGMRFVPYKITEFITQIEEPHHQVGLALAKE